MEQLLFTGIDFSRELSEYICDIKNIRGFITGAIPVEMKRFFKNEANIPKILDAITRSMESKSISCSFTTIMSASTFFGEIFANSEAFCEYIRGVIEHSKDAAVITLQSTDALIKSTLKFISRTENYDVPFVDCCRDCIDKIMENLNIVNMNFLFTILMSRVPVLTINNNDLDFIMFPEGKLNPDMLNFIFELNLISGYISFDINNWIHLHFYSLFAYATSSSASPTQARRIFDICSKEIQSHKTDNVLLHMIIDYFDDLNSYVKHEVVRHFKIIPANFVQMLTCKDTPNLLKTTIIDVINRSSEHYKEKLFKASEQSLKQHEIYALDTASLSRLVVN